MYLNISSKFVLCMFRFWQQMVSMTLLVSVCLLWTCTKNMCGTYCHCCQVPCKWATHHFFLNSLCGNMVCLLICNFNFYWANCQRLLFVSIRTVQMTFSLPKQVRHKNKISRSIHKDKLINILGSGTKHLTIFLVVSICWLERWCDNPSRSLQTMVSILSMWQNPYLATLQIN